jgi:predicted SAM-dependent methyltransferase
MKMRELMKLNLGCGFRKMEGFINIDNRYYVKPDVVADALALPFKDNSADEVCAIDFLEHIPIGKTVSAVEAIYSVLVPNGLFRHVTPSTDGRGAFQDPTHVSFWNINSWLYYCDDLYRNLYGIKAKFTGMLRDVITDQKNRIVHTHGELKAVK